MTRRSVLTALVVLSLAAAARADDATETFVRAAGAAFGERLAKATLPEDPLPTLLEGRNGSARHLDVAAIAKAAAGKRIAFVEDPGPAKALLLCQISETSVSRGSERVAHVVVTFELIHVASERVLAALVHEGILANGALVPRGKAWDEARASASMRPSVSSEVAAKLAKALADACARRKDLADAPLEVRSPRGDGPVANAPVLVASIEEALLAAGRTVRAGQTLYRRFPDATPEHSLALVQFVTPKVVKAGAGVALELDVGRVGPILHVSADGKATDLDPGPPPRYGPDDPKFEARVARVEGDRALITVGSDDKVTEGAPVELWRGTQRLAAATVVEVLKDSAWVRVQPGGEPVTPGDKAYGVTPAEEKAANDAAVNDAIGAVVRTVEALPVPEGRSRHAIKVGLIMGHGRDRAVVRELERAIKASARLELGDGGFTVDGDWRPFQPGGTNASNDALVLRAKVNGRVVATGVGRLIHEEGKVFPRAQWAEPFAHAFGPLDDDALVAAFRARLANAKLAGAKRLLAKVEANGVPVLAAMLEQVLQDAGVDVVDVLDWKAQPDVVVQARVEGEGATENGKPGARFVARVVAKRGDHELAAVETRTFKPE